MQALLERYLKSKSYPKSIIQDRKFLNSRDVLDRRLGNCESKAKERQTEKKVDKRRGSSPLAERLAWRRHSTGST